MKVSYIIPEGQYEFFSEVVPYLQSEKIEVETNNISKDTDLILAGILPITHEWAKPILDSGKPFVLWHWDLYSFVNLREPRWAQFLEMMPKAREVWSCTYEVARQLRERIGLDSWVAPAWIDCMAMRMVKPKVGQYAFYACSSGGFGKRPEWAQRACDMLGYRLETTQGHQLPRHDYYRLIKGCKVYIMPAFEESNGTIPALEAAACGQAVVMSDLPASREVFGNTVYYFPPNDFGELVKQLNTAWLRGPKLNCAMRAFSLYDVNVLSPRMTKRLKELAS